MSKDSTKEEADKDDKHAIRDHEEFVVAAERYIGRGAPRDSWNEPQRQAMQIVKVLGDMFRGCEKVEMLPELARAAKQLGGERTLQERRIQAMNLITVIAPRLLKPIGTPGTEWSNRAVADMLAFYLAEVDSKFDPLRQDLDDLLATMDHYDPTPKGRRGAKGAARILAELVVEANGALGLDCNPEATDDEEIERIRKVLQRDFDKHHSSIENADS